MQQASTWLAAGRYEVGEVVGRGGYGMVCRGVDRKTGDRVALKMLSPEAGRDPDVVERMLREQQALVALSGTCAVTAIDLCRLESGAPCLVMEWLEGRDLEQQLSVWEAAGERGPLPQLREIVRALSQTLTRAHDIGIVHRDIKPANVFLVEAPVAGVRLLDFGLSRMKSAAPLTAMGMVMGSPSYIAPETWRGNSAVLDGRADLFALAVIIFRYLTGQLPFEARDLIAKMTAVTSGPRPSVVALRPDLPGAIDAWMSRALAVEAADRFQTGSDFCAAFEAALRGEMLAVSAEVSGVREIASAELTTESGHDARKVTLASAFRAAASLLKRFTQPRERGTPAPSVPPEAASVPAAAAVGAPPTLVTAASAADEEAPPRSERKTVWLDSGELQDFVPEEPEAATSEGEPTTLRRVLTPPPEIGSVPSSPEASGSAPSQSEEEADDVSSRTEQEGEDDAPSPPPSTTDVDVPASEAKPSKKRKAKGKTKSSKQKAKKKRRSAKKS